MSVEHPTCPHCEEPLDKTVENGVAGLRPCTNSKCPGKEPDVEELTIDRANPDAARESSRKNRLDQPTKTEVYGLGRFLWGPFSQNKSSEKLMKNFATCTAQRTS